MKKLKLLLTALILLVSGGGNIVWADTDYTSKVNNAKEGWTGATGTYANAKAANQTALNIAERYYGDDAVSGASTSIFSQTVTELDNGTYTVIFYATANNARCSAGNGGIQADATDLVYVYAGSDKTHKTYVSSYKAASYDYPGEYIVSGVTVTNGTLELGMYAEKTGTQWQTIQVKALIRTDEAANNNGVDMTKAIINADIYNVTQTEAPYGWTFDKRTAGNDNRTVGTGNTAIELWNNTNMEIDVYQQISNLPNGAYKVTAYCHDRNGTGGYSVYGYNPSTIERASGTVNVSGDNDPANYADITTSNYLIVTNNKINVGFKGSSSASWVTADNFRLTYYGPTVKDVATALPVGGDMDADTWYYFDEGASGIYSLSATNLGNIVYTTTATDLLGDVSAHFSTNIKFTGGSTRYYIMSSSDNNLTISSKICDDGAYRFLKTSDYKYLSRGGTYYSQAIADNYGIPVCITYDNGNVTLQFVDNSKYLYDADNGNLYTDNTSNKNFAIEATDGGYYIINKNTTTNSTYGQKVYIDGSDGNRVKMSSSNSTVWILEDVATSAHATRMQAIKDAQAAAIATSASIDGISSQSDMADYLSTYYTSPTNILITGTGGTVSEAYQKDAPNNDEYSVYTETVNDLKAGLYKLSVNAFERISSNDNAYDKAGGNAGLSYVFAGSEKVQLHSVFGFPADAAYADNGVDPAENVTKGTKYYPNSTISAGVAFEARKYVNDVYVWVTGSSLTFGIKIPHSYEGNTVGTSCSNWICYNNFSLTYYEEADATDLSNLSSAISTYDHLGFDDDEYAPYNNLTLQEKIDEAKAITLLTNSKSAIQAATTALTESSWTQNVGEVDAVYNGNMSVANGNNPSGWTRESNGWGKLVVPEEYEGAVANFSSTTNNTAWYYNNGGTAKSSYYGKEGAYTMPLKASTTYLLKVKYCSQGTAGDGLISSYKATVGQEGKMPVLSNHELGANSTQTFKEQFVSFTTTDAGNYVLELNNTGNLFFTDVSIKKMPANVTATVSSAGLATFCTYYPVDFTGKAVRAYKASVTGDNSVQMTQVFEVPAGTGVVLRGAAGSYDIPVIASADALDGNLMVGTWDLTDVAASTSGSYNYMLSNGSNGVGFYEVASATTSAAGKAYLHTTTELKDESGIGSRIVMFFVDEVSGIKNYDAETVVNNQYFDLQGRKVNNPAKGLYILNGKKVVLK